MSEGIIAPYPWFLNKPLEVVVNDIKVTTRVKVREWTDHLRPLLAHILKLHQQKLPERLMIAIGGPPGTGKSVLAEQIHWLAAKNFLPGCTAIALPMDGFHYPNHYLEKHKRSIGDGVTVPLTQLKGTPETYDVENMKRYLKVLRGGTEEMNWPGYSRITHEPVLNRYRIHHSVNLVIVEGNYMLLDRGPFAGIPGFFDFHIYLDLPAAGIISNLMQRHMDGGKTMEEAKNWVKKIDLANARLAESSRENADLIIDRNRTDDIVGLRWRQENGPRFAPPPVDQPPPDDEELPPQSAASA